MRKIIVSSLALLLIGSLAYFAANDTDSLLTLKNHALRSSENLEELKQIMDMLPCLKESDPKINDAAHALPKADQQTLMQQHRKVFTTLKKYLKDHQGEAPTVEEFKKILEDNGCLEGPTAAVWQIFLDSFTQCSAMQFGVFKQIMDMEPCLKESDQKIDDAANALAKEDQETLMNQHQTVMQILENYVHEHNGEAPTVEEFKKILEDNGCLEGPTAAVWQIFLDSFTQCSASLYNVVEVFKQIQDMIPCLKKDDKAINQALQGSSADVQQTFIKQHREVIGDLHTYLKEHKGEAPSAEEFKAILEKHGALTGSAAAVWKLILDSFTRCSALFIFDMEEVFKQIQDMIPCLKKDDKAINQALQGSSADVQQTFMKQHREIFGDLHNYFKEHNGDAPSAEEFKAILEKHGALTGSAAAVWKLILDSFTRCSALFIFDMEEFQKIDEILPCLKADDKQIHDAFDAAPADVQAEFKKEHRQVFSLLFQYFHEHDGEVPSVDQFKAMLDKFNVLSGPAADIWKIILDTYTRCAS